ncbi:MAG: cytidine deaminase [Bacteroidetes bacterium]|nr:cytidine deaminase [Bacteroidota bacterium]MBS1755665.1 cytidine deaminase [Bacteroidota bacterium]
MRTEEIKFEYQIFTSSDELAPEDKTLVEAARAITAKAYAPYSQFHVGAVALLNNGALVSGTNQENASYPVGNCAERVLLATAAVLHTNVPVKTMAISYHNMNAGGKSHKPVSPCGMCRQYLREYEERTKHPIRLILTGMDGEVFIINSVKQLLPFSFGSEDMA